MINVKSLEPFWLTLKDISKLILMVFGIGRPVFEDATDEEIREALRKYYQQKQK